ncbi:MAG: hypothetical protein SGJ07_07945, partial [Rhodospirillaceae bacterium]|nr:hypothetical protein [Rhodospirillaceae bacterium]
EFAQSQSFIQTRAKFVAMLDAYRNRNWDAARAAISEARDSEPALAPVYDLYEDRIAAYEGDPPPAGWDGVFEARTKTG